MDRTGAARLSQAERRLLVIPLLGGAFFGALTYFFGAIAAPPLGYSGDDQYIYRAGGAATIGYAFALWPIVFGDGNWTAARNVVAATLTFNLVSILVCFVEIALGHATPIVYVILLASLVITAVTASPLRKYGAPPRGRDVAQWVIVTLALATIAATLFGLLPLFPEFVSKLAGYKGTDTFVFRQAGASTLGYAVLGVLQLRSPRWEAMRLPTIMALAFNGLAAAASALELATGGITLTTILVAPASLAFTVAIGAILVRRGQ